MFVCIIFTGACKFDAARGAVARGATLCAASGDAVHDIVRHVLQYNWCQRTNPDLPDLTGAGRAVLPVFLEGIYVDDTSTSAYLSPHDLNME